MAIGGGLDEQRRAERLSAAIDQLLAGAQGADAASPPAEVEPADAGLLDTARQLARLPALLGPVDAILERQVICQVQTAGRRARRPGLQRPRLRLGWAAAGLVTLLLLALLATPLGDAAVASFRAVFDLGRTDVEITQATTPTVAAGVAGVRQQLTLEEAQALAAFEIPRLAYLPAGYGLQEVNGYSYPDLPPWVPQPLFVELVYGDQAGGTCNLRIYPIVLGSEASISAMNLEATSVEKVQDLVIGGQRGVLLRVGGGEWQEVVWEHGQMILALASDDLAEVDLLQMAQSVGR